MEIMDWEVVVMKLCNDEFRYYAPFHNNFEDVYIYKVPNGFYFVCKEPIGNNGFENWIFNGTKETVNGWLYGCVQAKYKYVTEREEVLL